MRVDMHAQQYVLHESMFRVACNAMITKQTLQVIDVRRFLDARFQVT